MCACFNAGFLPNIPSHLKRSSPWTAHISFERDIPTTNPHLLFQVVIFRFYAELCTGTLYQCSPKKKDARNTVSSFPVSTPWPSLFDSAVSDSSSAWWVVPWRMTSPFFVRGLQFQFQTFPEIFEKLVFLMLEFWLKNVYQNCCTYT